MAVQLLDDDELQKIYVWVDSIPLSRPKRNISRDFSDGVLLAEVVHHYFPKLVELHNYSSANSVRQKLYNWSTLNQKVFKRLNFEVRKTDVDAIVACKPGVVEAILMQLQHKIAEYRSSYHSADDMSPGGDSNQEHGGPSSAAYTGYEHAAAMSAAPPARSFQSQGSLSAGSPAAAPAGPSPSGTLGASGGGGGTGGYRASTDAAVIAEKDATIAELRETIDILELKIKKLEQLVRLKDSRIQTLTVRLQGPGQPGVPT